jgi:hypothetical protein
MHDSITRPVRASLGPYPAGYAERPAGPRYGVDVPVMHTWLHGWDIHIVWAA